MRGASPLFPFAVGGGCGFEAPALPTDVTSDTTPELSGLVEFDGAAPSMELPAIPSPLVPLGAGEGDDGADPVGVPPSFALTDAGAKPR
jgi:hypothetical protein